RLFQFIEALVGEAEQSAFHISILGMNGNAEIEGQGDIEFEKRNFAFILRANAAAERGGLLGIGLRQQEREFIATDTKSKIGGANGFSQSGGGKLQNVIAL